MECYKDQTEGARVFPVDTNICTDSWYTHKASTIGVLRLTVAERAHQIREQLQKRRDAEEDVAITTVDNFETADNEDSVNRDVETNKAEETGDGRKPDDDLLLPPAKKAKFVNIKRKSRGLLITEYEEEHTRETTGNSKSSQSQSPNINQQNRPMEKMVTIKWKGKGIIITPYKNRNTSQGNTTTPRPPHKQRTKIEKFVNIKMSGVGILFKQFDHIVKY